MTDKEQIMIDGVDVSECDNFREGYYHPDTGVCFKCDTNCQHAAYYLKEQLARKAQECEELKKKLNTSEEWRIKAESLNEKQDLENPATVRPLRRLRKFVRKIPILLQTEHK